MSGSDFTLIRHQLFTNLSHCNNSFLWPHYRSFQHDIILIDHAIMGKSSLLKDRITSQFTIILVFTIGVMRFSVISKFVEAFFGSDPSPIR